MTTVDSRTTGPTRPAMLARTYPYREESHARLRAPIDRVFARLDAHAQLAEHMRRRSWRMGWGRMAVHLEAGAGGAIGSRIEIGGRIFGIRLRVVEEVIERVPPTRKVWETVGTPRLLVIGPYRMGFELGVRGPAVDDVSLSVFIDFSLPDRGLPWLLGRTLGRRYARWCTEQMAADARAALDTASADDGQSPPGVP